MGIERIRKELTTFQSSIQKLSTGINKASSLWKDEKYLELSSSMGIVANQSKDVMLSGERCCSSVERFNKISSEQY